MSVSSVEDSARPAIRIVKVGVQFDGPTRGGYKKSALSDVTIEIPDGQFCVLVGRSGCGKTTLLNLLAGLLAPTTGQVEVLGGSPTDASGQVGYMFARDALLPWRTASRNIEFVLESRGIPRAARRELARRYLAMVKLGSEVNAYPGQLSQGMRQRVALARTWAFEPRLLLMDEPFAALDAQTRSELQIEFLRIWADERRTVVFVTHDLNEALILADRVIVLDSGRIIDEFRVPFDQPRDAGEVSETLEFQQLHRRLRASVEAGVSGIATSHRTPAGDLDG